MNFIKITNMDNIPAAQEHVVSIRDRHNDGKSNIDVTGFWIFGGGRVAVDSGNRMHCLNDMVFNSQTRLPELSACSVGGVVRGHSYSGNGFNDLEYRVCLNEGETIEDLMNTLLMVKRYKVEMEKDEERRAHSE